MSSSILRTKPEEIDSAEKRRNFTISVIGCGPVGILHACLFAEAGFKVTCAEADQTIVNLLAKGKSPFSKPETEVKLKNYVRTGCLTSTNDIKDAVSKSDIIIITTPVGIDEKKKPDYSNIEKTLKLVGSSLRQRALVIVASIVGLGLLEGTLKEVLENTSGYKVGTDIGLAYSPLRTSYGQASETMADYERVIAATDKASLDAATTVLETISKKGMRRTRSVKAAEMATFFEVAQQDVNAALANELALLCEKANVDYFEAQELAKTNVLSTLPSPSLTSGHAQEEPYLLLEGADNLNTRLRIASIAREVNEEIVKHAANLTKEALKECEKTPRRARISMLGISSTPNEKSSPKIMLKALVKLLEAKGAKVNLYDPYLSENDMTEMQDHFKKSLNEALEGTDCIMIITGHDQFKRLNLKKLKVLMKVPAAIVDFEGILEPDEVEKEGFIYRGLGRGVWTK
jgi:nucleotide sugar dehydrogenase